MKNDKDSWKWKERFIGSLVGVLIYHLIIEPLLWHALHIPPLLQSIQQLLS